MSSFEFGIIDYNEMDRTTIGPSKHKFVAMGVSSEERVYGIATDGILYEQVKFCDPWAYERMMGTHILREEYGYPVLSVDRPYAVGSSGQLRTRVQAFVESMEIKKIQGGAARG